MEHILGARDSSHALTHLILTTTTQAGEILTSALLDETGAQRLRHDCERACQLSLLICHHRCCSPISARALFVEPGKVPGFLTMRLVKP